MLYLAQVQKQELSLQALRLLAYQEAEPIWVVMAEPVVIAVTELITFSEGMLVLVELTPTHQVESIYDASSWVLNLVRTYLSSGITPDFLRQEAERAEKWRQNLTLENQELARRSLELEARLEQIQALEQNLRREPENNS